MVIKSKYTICYHRLCNLRDLFINDVRLRMLIIRQNKLNHLQPHLLNQIDIFNSQEYSETDSKLHSRIK